jgi:hypothetical protein
MDSAAQLVADGLSYRPIPDLRNIPLGELASQADDGSRHVDDVEARMVPGRSGQLPVSATMFSSAIS